MTTHEVLVAARNLIDQDGWWQSGHGCSEGEHCVGLALLACGRNDDAERAAYVAFADATGLDVSWPTGIDVTPIYNWNDDPSRTKAEVLAAFDRAIAATAPPPDFSQLRDHLELFAEAATCKEGK